MTESIDITLTQEEHGVLQVLVCQALDGEPDAEIQECLKDILVKLGWIRGDYQ